MVAGEDRVVVAPYGAMTDKSLDTADRTASSGSMTIAPIFLGLLWLATSAWTARASYLGTEVGLDGALADAIGSLPSTVAATVFTSATIASAVSARIRLAITRLLVGLGVGVGFGLLAAVGTRYGYGDGSSITALALVVGAAGVLGGAAAMLPNQVLEAGLWGTTWVLFAGVIFGALGPQLTTLFGGGDTAEPAAQESARMWAAVTQSIATGALAGVHASTVLRRERQAWGWYPVAGAFGGILLIVADRITYLGGSTVVDVITDGSAVVNLDDAARLRHAVTVLVIGAIIGAARARRATFEYD